MKEAVTLAICVIATCPVFAKGGSAPSAGTGAHTVSAYVTKNGTYVAPTMATNPNSTKVDNYSSRGNVNPANGKVGTRDPSK